jgi:hypothetical protein
MNILSFCLFENVLIFIHFNYITPLPSAVQSLCWKNDLMILLWILCRWWITFLLLLLMFILCNSSYLGAWGKRKPWVQIFKVNLGNLVITHLKKISLCFGIHILSCFSVDLCMFILLGIHQTSWICTFLYFFKIERFSANSS